MSWRGVLQLAAYLGYTAPARPVDPVALKLPGLEHAHVISDGKRKRSGYSVLIGEARSAPHSLRPLARALQREVHDSPLGILAITDDTGRWERLIILPPAAGRGTARSNYGFASRR